VPTETIDLREPERGSLSLVALSLLQTVEQCVALFEIDHREIEVPAQWALLHIWQSPQLPNRVLDLHAFSRYPTTDIGASNSYVGSR
jgi:hypothetical protein